MVQPLGVFPVEINDLKENIMNTNVTDQVQTIINTLTEALNDATKHDKGVKAAGTRLRTTLLNLTKEAKVVRANILSDQKNN